MATGSTVCGMYGLVSENCMSGILDISHINVDFMWGIHMWILSLYKGMCDMLDALKNFIWSMREREGGGERERESYHMDKASIESSAFCKYPAKRISAM